MRKELIIKDTKELARDKYILFNIIVMPIVLVGLLAAITLLSVEPPAEGEAVKPPAALVLEDPGDPSAIRLAEVLGWPVYDSLEEALEGYNVVVVVPSGFSENLELGIPAPVTVYVVVEEPSLAALLSQGQILAALDDAARLLTAELRGVSLEALTSPLTASTVFLYRGSEVGPSDLIFMIGFPLLAGFIAFALGAVAVQIGAISIAVEREARTLEALLAMPVSRLEIAFSKLVAATLISVVAAIVFEASFIAYVYLSARLTLEGGEGASAILYEALSYLAERPLALAVIALVAVASTLNMALLGILVGSLFAGDIRGAVVSSSYLSLLAGIPVLYEAVAFAGGPSPALLALFHVSPIYYPFSVAKGYAAGDAALALLYVVVEAVYIAVAAIAAAKLLSSEAVVRSPEFRGILKKLRK